MQARKGYLLFGHSLWYPHGSKITLPSHNNKENGERLRRMNRKIFLPVLLCCCLASCAPLVFFGAGTAVGVGAFKWYQGALTVIYQAPYIATWDATLKALEDLKLRIESKKHDLTSGKIAATDTDEKPVTVSLSYRSAQETEVVIRVGFFGDKDASNIIKEKIRKALFK